MRIWLNPDAMAARGITVEDVETALNSQNAGAARRLAGGAGQGLHHPRGPRLRHAAQFARMPIVARRGSRAQDRRPRRRRRAGGGPGRHARPSAPATRLHHPPGRHRPGRGRARRTPPPVPLQRQATWSASPSPASRQANDLEISDGVPSRDRGDQRRPAQGHPAERLGGLHRASPATRSRRSGSPWASRWRWWPW